MKVLVVVLTILVLCPTTSAATPSDFANRICMEHPRDYMCVTIKIPRKAKRQYLEWAEKFPNHRTRRLVMMVNRRNTLLWSGHVIALPMLFEDDLLAYAPFPREKSWVGPKHVVIDLNQLAWGAYEPISSSRARLVRWGPANGGSKRCKETGRLECKTPVGTWQVYEIKKGFARSSLYPVECSDKKKCGHPYYNVMKFGPHFEALHGERAGHVPGANVSHGCVRIFREDSDFLINHFVEIRTMVVVLGY